MKTLIVFCFSFFLLCTKSFGQADVKATYDTIKTYDVFLEANKTVWGVMEYKANGQLISVETYNKYKMHWNAAYACKPCNLVTLDAKDKILHEAFQYQNCLSGYYKEYYTDGTIKVDGQYKENPEPENWEKLGERGLCDIRVGKWVYYNAEGKAQKSEQYENGVLVKVDNLNISNSTKTQTENTENTEKVPLGQKIKSKFQKKPSTEEGDPYLEKNISN